MKDNMDEDCFISWIKLYSQNYSTKRRNLESYQVLSVFKPRPINMAKELSIQKLESEEERLFMDDNLQEGMVMQSSSSNWLLVKLILYALNKNAINKKYFINKT